MSFKASKATRSAAKLRIGIDGPAGSGKTYSALLLASGIVPIEKVYLIDTEENSGHLYSHLGSYNVVPFEPPYSPKRYAEGIQYCENEGAELIIIDSTSHCWDGKGGCLDMHQALGGRFQDWAKVTPHYRRFIDYIVGSKCHIITTNRKKEDYSIEDVNGRKQIKKVGLKSIQRDGFSYELTVAMDINIDHYAEVTKDRTGLFVDEGPFRITKETGEKLLAWSKGE